MQHQSIFQKFKFVSKHFLPFCLYFIFHHAAFSQSLIDAVKANNIQQVKQLVNPQNINEVDENGATPLMWAAYKGDLKMVQLLVEKGADVTKKGLIYLNDSTYYGNLIGIVAGEGKMKVLQFLIEECSVDVNDWGYNPDSGYEDGASAIMWAREKGNAEISAYLFEKGAIDINQIRLYYEAGDIEKAAFLIESALPLYAKIYGHNDTTNFVIRLLVLAKFFDEANNYQKAETYYLQAKQVLETINATKVFMYEDILYKLATNYSLQGKFIKAIEQMNEKLVLVADRTGKNHPIYADILVEIGLLYEKSKNFAKSLKYYNQALNILRNTQVDFEYTSYLNLINDIARLYKDLNQNEQALSLYEEALENSKSKLGKESPEYRFYLDNLGQVYFNLGQYDKALSSYSQALVLEEKTLGKEHSFYIKYSKSLAYIYYTIGQYDKALPLYLEALEITEKSVGKDHSEYGNILINLALLYNKTGQYEKALPLYLEVLAITEKTLGKENPTYVNTLHIIAQLHHILGQYDQALPLYIEALEIAEKTFGKLNSSCLYIKQHLAELYHTLGQYKQALPLYLEALEITEKTLGKENSLYGTILSEIAELYNNQGQYDKAMPLFLAGLDNIMITLGKDNYIYVRTLNNLATLFNNVGQYDKALPLYLEVLEISEKTLGREHPLYAVTLNNLAILYNSIGQYEKSLAISLDALEITEMTLGKDHSSYGISLNNLALIYYTIGQYDKALPYFLEALENIEKSLGKEHFNYGTYLGNLALNYSDMGLYDKALPLYLEALENIEKSLGIEHSNYGRAQSNLASFYMVMGQYDKALLLYHEAIVITEKTLGKEHSDYGLCLNNLGIVYLQMGQYEKALPIFLEALENTEKSLGTEHSQYAMNLSNLAQLYSDMGQFDKALPLYIEALEITEKTFGKEHSEYGFRMNNLAQNYSDMGLYDKALPLFLTALENTEKLLGKQHSTYGSLLNNLSGLYYTTGQYYKAMENFQVAAQLQINLLKQNFTFLSENEQEKYAKSISSNFELYQSFYLRYFPQNNEVASDAYNLELSVKGMILQSGIQMRQAFISSADSAGRVQFEEWLALRQQINFLLNKPVSERYASVDSLEDIANTMERSLMQQSQEFSRMQSVFDVSWKDVQQGLKENEAAVELISFNYHDANRWTGSIYYAALIVRKTDTVPQMLFLFEEADLIELLPGTDAGPSSYDLAYKGSRASGVAYFDQTTYQGDALYKLIWQPIDSLLQGVEKVYFSPSGMLHRISMAALPHPETGLLMDHYQLVQLSSTRQLAAPSKEYKQKDAVVFGGIDYELPATVLSSLSTDQTGLHSTANYAQLRSFVRQYSGFSYLQGSMEEATAVSSHLGNQVNTTTYSKHDATEEKFMELSGKTSPSVIHIATHGFYFPDTISERQRDEMMLTALGEDRFRVTDDPLMRSALVMAGANYAWAGNSLPEGVEDGILTAKEVSSMNLSNTKLVVLSACQTGLGDVNGSEGITGLQRAFKMAGVENLIMSLWSIPDKESREFMEVFYGQWPAHPDINLAFTETQKKMRNKYPQEPYKWAGFVLVE